jgi:N-acetylneuraminate synthase
LNTIKIAGREIGFGCPPYLIAEMSGNHNGDIVRALSLIEAASRVGADAVKLQTYTADTITINYKSADFSIDAGPWAGKTLYELYDEAHTPWEWHPILFHRAAELGIAIFSSPFDDSAVDFLEKLNVPAYKIASFELLDLSLVKSVAKTHKPLIISSGMANEQEIGEALEAARSAGANEIVLLHCVSGYPTPTSEINLQMIRTLAHRFEVPVGLSDHTLGTVASTAAVALGACVIEKHFTLAREDGGPDSTFSLEPDEFAELVKNSRMTWDALGQSDFQRPPSETQNRKFRRSLYIVEDIEFGETFTEQNLRSIRPGFGMSPKHLFDVLGKKAAESIKRGTALRPEHILNDE